MSVKLHLPKLSGESSAFRQASLFVVLCIISCAGVLAYALHSSNRTDGQHAESALSFATEHQPPAALRQRPHLLFRNTAPGRSYGRLSVLGLDGINGVRYTTALECERVYGSVFGGLCLQASRGVFTTYRGVSFDEKFQPVHTFDLAGTPSRTRVSKNGRMAATTVFVRGDSYNAGGFSTRTTLIDLNASNIIGNLEDFSVLKDGQPFRRADFNFWGVTFHPNGQRFLATLASGGVLYLVDGRVAQREMRVIRTGVECPSLSPEGTHVAFKSRKINATRLIWELHVLNLRTGEETIIPQDRSVDDQAEWLDSIHVLYTLPRNSVGSASSDIWIARADGTEPSRVYLADASSPCVIRP